MILKKKIESKLLRLNLNTIITNKGLIQLKIIKRNGKKVNLNIKKIKNAIMYSMRETIKGVDYSKLDFYVSNIENSLNENAVYDVNEIQELILEQIKDDSILYSTYKTYMLYKNKVRYLNKEKYNLLDDKFISKYKHLENPMNQLGNFVFYRTYSRWLDLEKRREYWYETVRRSIEYNCSLDKNVTKEEAELIFDNMFNLKQFCSGRTMWVGNTDIVKKYVSANYNCSMTQIKCFNDFCELFYLLLLGCGVGFRVLPEDINNFENNINTNITLTHKAVQTKPKVYRYEKTRVSGTNIKTIIIGDSKEGWVDCLRFYFENIIDNNVKEIILDYDNIRLKGERLKTFGGYSSGYNALKVMFEKIHNVLMKIEDKIKPINCMDIANIIGENVVCGGVRRTSEICGFDKDDINILNAKSELYYTDENNNWCCNNDIIHRTMSNNSIIFTEKPSREYLYELIDKIRYSGEPGFYNLESALKRRKDAVFSNPCGEIILRNKGFCNLTTINVCGFIENKKLNLEKLLEAQKYSVRMGIRMTLPEIELEQWNKVNIEDRLIGCSLTGWQDMVNITNISIDEQILILKELRKIAHSEAKSYSKELNINEPLLKTTIKPEGTISQLPCVSSGVHYSHSEYYIRRVRVSSSDPLCKICEDLQYDIYPEVGQNYTTATTKVIEFPMKSPKGKTKYNVSAIEQLEIYKMFMNYYVDHNCSITISVKNDEWEHVKEWLFKNWDDVIGITFLSLDDSFYKLMPYESITKEEYEQKCNKMRKFIPSLLSKYETEYIESTIIDNDCANGVCPIR